SASPKAGLPPVPETRRPRRDSCSLCPCVIPSWPVGAHPERKERPEGRPLIAAEWTCSLCKVVSGSLAPASSALLKGFAMLGQVEPVDLALLAHPKRHDHPNGLEQDERRKSRPSDGRCNTVKLDQHLAGVALKETRISGRRIWTD